MRRATCTNGHSFMLDFSLAAKLDAEGKHCPVDGCDATGTVMGTKPKHDAPYHPSDSDPKWDEGDPTANY